MLCKHEVIGSIPIRSTKFCLREGLVPRIARLRRDRLLHSPRSDDRQDWIVRHICECAWLSDRKMRQDFVGAPVLMIDIVKREKHETLSGVRQVGRMPAGFLLGPCDDSSLSKSKYTDRVRALAVFERSAVACMSDGREFIGSRDFRPGDQGAG